METIVSIGNQGFDRLREEGSFYIDKTYFIKEWWESRDVITLITRPRRFGKTLNMNMLYCFFSNQYVGRDDLFENLSIWKEEKYKKLQMVLYMVLGWMCIFLFYPIYKCDPNALLLFGLLVLGGAIYTLGTIFYSIGRFKRYYHFIFHLFILGGTVTHFLAFLICLY